MCSIKLKNLHEIRYLENCKANLWLANINRHNYEVTTRLPCGITKPALWWKIIKSYFSGINKEYTSRMNNYLFISSTEKSRYIRVAKQKSLLSLFNEQDRSFSSIHVVRGNLFTLIIVTTVICAFCEL